MQFFFDANGDNIPDLYIASGGNLQKGILLQDRIFISFGAIADFEGQGLVPAQETDPNRLPPMPINTACVRPFDFDGDGDMDLFVGGRSVAGSYGKAPRSYVLENDGKGFFTDKTVEIAPALEYPGMVTDARWADLTGDGKTELVVVGEWMNVSVFGWDGKANNRAELGHKQQRRLVEPTDNQ